MENLNVYKDLIKRMLTMVDAGVTDSAPAAYRQPSSVYTDPALFAREKARKVAARRPPLAAPTTTGAST